VATGALPGETSSTYFELFGDRLSGEVSYR
jgi:hypothetical protein